MKKLTFYNYIALGIVIIFLSLLFAGGVRAEQPAGSFYLGVGHHSGTYSEDGFPDVDFTGPKFEAGVYLVEDHLALEINYLVAQGNYWIIDFTGEALSLFLKPELPFAEGKGRVFGLVGFTKLSLIAKVFGYSVSMDEDSLSYGVGVELSPAENLRLGVEGIVYANEIDWDYSGVNFTINILF